MTLFLACLLLLLLAHMRANDASLWWYVALGVVVVWTRHEIKKG